MAMDHYYSRKPESASSPHKIGYTVGGRDMEFITDSGVFSKHQVDFGTDLLIKTVISEGFYGNVLDLGCGYGAVGISLYAHNPGIRLVMADINERAIELCRKNAELNIGGINSGNIGVSSGKVDVSSCYIGISSGKVSVNSIIGDTNGGNARIEIIRSDGFTEIDRLKTGLPDSDRLFDFILLNPPVRAGKSTVFKLYEDSFWHLAAGGKLYAVIQKKQGMESSYKELSRLFGNCRMVGRKSGYHVLCSLYF